MLIEWGSEMKTSYSISTSTYMSGVHFARREGFPIRILTHFSKFEYPTLARSEEDLMEKIWEIFEFCPHATIRLYTGFNRQFWRREKMSQQIGQVR